MGSYVPSNQEERRQMLAAVGVADYADLFAAIPPQLAVDRLNLPPGLSELEVRQQVEELAGENTVFKSCFRGAGAYRHFIPSIVNSVVNKESFLTAYTPYQAEISQGVLQSIFEFQTMICNLTGLDVANASLYDGASAAAEAVSLCRERKRARALVSAAAPPQVISAIRTYCFGNGMSVDLVPAPQGVTDPAALARLLREDVCCLYVQQPNYYGLLEDGAALAAAAHQAGARFILGLNPIAAALLPSAGEMQADVAVGEGQPLGLPLSFGGPYLGFMAIKSDLLRRLPGRVVGETVDAQGRRAFVLTLQAREQHIRREKASSNICSNQALCALTAAVYLAAMGPEGLAQAARSCYAHAHYLADGLAKLGFKLCYEGEFFHEFVTEGPLDPARLEAALARQGILCGLPLEGRRLLWCATELNSKTEMDRLLAVLAGLVKEEVAR